MFLVKYDEDGIFVDTCIDVSPILNQTAIGMLAAERLTGVKNSFARDICAAVQVMDLRARMDKGTHGPYLLRTEEPMSMKDLEFFLRNVGDQRRKEILKGARI